MTKSYLHHPHLPAGASTELTIELEVDKGHYAYVKKFKLTPKFPVHSSITNLLINPTKEFYDKFTKTNQVGVEGKAEIKTSFEISENLSPGEQQAIFTLMYQACSKTYCLLPKSIELKVPFTSLPKMSAIPYTTDSPETKLGAKTKGQKKTSFLNRLDEEIKKAISLRDWLTLLFVAFLGGVVTSFLPCIYPMIPITLAVLGATDRRTSRRKAFVLSLCYVLGIALTYAVLGAIAASTGQLFGAFLGNIYVTAAITCILVAMALSMFGLFEIKCPAFISNKLGSKKTSTNYLGSFAAGLIFGVIASPCVGPVLISILTYVAQTQDIMWGFILLFVFALGLGQLFIFLGLSMQSLRRLPLRLPKAGPWMNTIKYIFGCIILWMAGSYAYPLFSSHLVSPPSVNSEMDPPWNEYNQENLAKATVEGKGIVIDFYADWCSACKKLELYTFTHPEVRKLGENFIWIKFDATEPTKSFRHLAKKYDILGLPHIVFYGPKGNYRKDLTLNGFESHKGFLERMKKALISIKKKSPRAPSKRPPKTQRQRLNSK